MFKDIQDRLPNWIIDTEIRFPETGGPDVDIEKLGYKIKKEKLLLDQENSKKAQRDDYTLDGRK